jgi:hypothetical protein
VLERGSVELCSFAIVIVQRFGTRQRQGSALATQTTKGECSSRQRRDILNWQIAEVDAFGLQVGETLVRNLHSAGAMDGYHGYWTGRCARQSYPVWSRTYVD